MHAPPLPQVRNEFYSGAHGAFLVFDVCNKASFDALGGWLLEMRNHLTDPDKDMDSIVIVVCGNKVHTVTPGLYPTLVYLTTSFSNTAVNPHHYTVYNIP